MLGRLGGVARTLCAETACLSRKRTYGNPRDQLRAKLPDDRVAHETLVAFQRGYDLEKLLLACLHLFGGAKLRDLAQNTE